MKIQNFLIVIFVNAGLMVAAHLAGLWVMLGAHPFWSDTVTYIGLASGAIVASLTYWKFPRTPKSILTQSIIFATLAVSAIAASTYGKRGFAASYADDTQAGQIWFYGFIVFVFAVFCTLSALSRYSRSVQSE